MPAKPSAKPPAARPSGDASSSANALARQVRWGQPQPELTGRIAACACGEGTRAGLFLLNGDWARAHAVAQDMAGPIGAHWHALVHRHEPDYENSKYWLRRVGKSPIYPRLAEAAASAGHAAQVAPDGARDPQRFTECLTDASQHAWTRPLDALELQLLLEHCLSGSL